MRALLFALLFTVTTGCGSKTDASKVEPTTERKADEAAKPSSGGPGKSGNGEPVVSKAVQDKATEDLQARGEAKVLAENAKEAADAEVEKTHKVVLDKLQQDFDVSDRRINPLKEKIAKATGAKRVNADTAATEVKKREKTVMASIAKLRDATGAEWGTTKTQVETGTAALNVAIDALEAALQ